jgi:thiamine-phosphate pyrophosphorylase
MPLLNNELPLLYLVSNGETTTPAAATTAAAAQTDNESFAQLLALVRTAVAARFSLIQLREKNLSARDLYQLTIACARITRGTGTRLLINDRADIAQAALADGVHLTTRSLETHIIRRTFGADFLIGVSTHSLNEARTARDEGADFATFGPAFETPSKQQYGAPIGLDALREAANALSDFPLIALGGITRSNALETLRAGARGIAAIRLFNDSGKLEATARAIRNGWLYSNS